MSGASLRMARVPAANGNIQSDVLPGGYYVEVDLEERRVMIVGHREDNDGEDGTLGRLDFTWSSFNGVCDEIAMLSGQNGWLKVSGRDVGALECGDRRIEFTTMGEPAAWRHTLTRASGGEPEVEVTDSPEHPFGREERDWVGEVTSEPLYPALVPGPTRPALPERRA